MLEALRMDPTAAFFYSIPIQEVVGNAVDAFQYTLFGHDKQCIHIDKMCDETQSPIGLCLGQLATLVRDWTPRKDGPWCVLVLSGWSDFKSQDVRKAARAETLHVAAGMDLHFDRKFAQLQRFDRRVEASLVGRPAAVGKR